MKGGNKQFGSYGENLATDFLKSHNYEIIERNYYTRGGELDIIAWKKTENSRTLCFIEVKTRSLRNVVEKDFKMNNVSEFGSAERATSIAKQRRMKFAAKYFCIQKNINPEDILIQFEHVSVYILQKYIKCHSIRHYIIPQN